MSRLRVRDSGILLKWVLGLDITLSEFNPVNVAGLSYIPLPRKVQISKEVVNMKNNDQECSKWALTRFLNPVSVHGERITPL